MIPESLTERQQRIAALSHDLAQRLSQRADEHDRNRTFPHENYVDLHTHGYLRLTVPQVYGGEEANLFEFLLAQEHLARGDGATAMVVGMTLLLVGRLNDTRSWPEAFFATLCRRIVEEGALINTAASEPEMGSPSRGGLPATTATPVEDGWLINGHKQFVTGAPVLRYFAVSVALPPAPDAPRGSRAIAIVEAGTPGLRMVDTWSDNLSLRSTGSYDVLLENVFVPDAWVFERQPVDVPVDAIASVTSTAWFALSLAAAYLGIGQAACDSVCAYARERTPTALGRPIATLPIIQRRVGESAIALSAARAMLYQTAWDWVKQPGQRLAMAPRIAAAKYLCTNAAIVATDQAMRIAGSFGLMRTLPLERYFRDARAGITQPPNDDAALELVGRTTLGLM